MFTQRDDAQKIQGKGVFFSYAPLIRQIIIIR